MSNAFASYVEKYLLNTATATAPDIDDLGNEETLANVSEKIVGDDGAKSAHIPLSKLRIQNTKLLAETDPKYRGKRVTRKEIGRSTDAVQLDLELSKYFVCEGDSDEEISESGEGLNSNDDAEDDLYMQMGEEVHSGNEGRSSNSEISDEESEIESDVEGNDDEFEDDRSVDGEDNESEDEDLDDSDKEEGEQEYFKKVKGKSKENVHPRSESNNVSIEDDLKLFKTFSDGDSSHLLKGIAVKNQCSIFDSLFEIRIGIQKILSISNQLPQHDTYKLFLANENYPQYKVNLIEARKSLKKLINKLLAIQQILLSKSSETKQILEDISPISSELGDDAEIEGKTTLKRKKKFEEFEEVLKKRHCALAPYRTATLTKWHEKSKLLSYNKNKFSSFDISPSQQIENILSNKDQLIKRTQMLGISRGNMYHILGKSLNDQQENISTEEYDSEIFDDTDFYSRMLEDLLKSKVSVSEDMTEVSRKWIDIQKLRKKAKKKVDTKASKGRKIRFEVMSKLQQYMAPCKPSLMEETATNRLFSSLFDQSLSYNISEEK